MFLRFYVYLYISFDCLRKKADHIVLPRANDITSVDITADGSTVSYSDKTWICKIISDISAAEPTGKESVQDIPQAENYIKVVLITAAEASTTLYVYEDTCEFYIEQPYQGIYKTDSELYERLHIQK